LVFDYLRWRDPIRINYLIPRGHYDARDFPGASGNERHVDSLIVGLGEYTVLLRVTVKTEMEIVDAPWAFLAAENAVSDVGSNNPSIVRNVQREDGRMVYQDWHGRWHNSSQGGTVVHRPDAEWVMGHLISAKRAYRGELEVSFAVKGHKTIKKRLPFIVEPDRQGDIPFLGN
jgi:hypothetical protein